MVFEWLIKPIFGSLEEFFDVLSFNSCLTNISVNLCLSVSLSLTHIRNHIYMVLNNWLLYKYTLIDMQNAKIHQRNSRY